MTKMGTFKGLPVYKLSLYEWEGIDSLDKEEIYVVEMKVYYHDQMIGKLGLKNNLYDFDEDKFELLQKEWKMKRDREQYMTAAKKQVEKEMGSQPTCAEKPVKESVEATAADEFMATWREKIDKEIDDMKAEIARMGVEFNAVD